MSRREGAEGGADVALLIPAEALRARVEELGRQIERDYAGKRLKLVGVLKGSYVFLADLSRSIDLPLEVDFIGISSYEGRSSSGVVKITSDLAQPIEGEDVLVVEDIIDTGLTMRYLLDNLSTRRPASLALCALLEKPSRARVAVRVDYRGFAVGDDFVVGYGLDCDGRMRNLPYIATVRGAEGP